MTTPSIDKLIDDVLRREGWPAVTEARADRGGLTKGGVTRLAWQEHIGRPRARLAAP